MFIFFYYKRTAIVKLQVFFDEASPLSLTCPGPDGRLVALLAAVGHHHHPIGSAGREALEGGLLAARLNTPPLLQRVVPPV